MHNDQAMSQDSKVDGNALPFGALFVRLQDCQHLWTGARFSVMRISRTRRLQEILASVEGGYAGGQCLTEAQRTHANDRRGEATSRGEHSMQRVQQEVHEAESKGELTLE